MKRTISLVAIITLVTMAQGQNPQQAPSLLLRDAYGRNIRLSNYRGKVVLLNFWATWCPPCRAEMPDLVKMQQENKNRGLQVIGITYPPEALSAVRRFIRRLRVNYPVAVGTKQTRNLFDQGETLPLTIVIDRDGNIRDRIEGILVQEDFEQKIRPLFR